MRIRYDEGCLAAHALNVIGDRWALLVVRELMFAAKRFQAIRAGIPGVTASVLTARLEQLRQDGIVVHEEAFGAYSLTDAGRSLMPVLEALCRWARAVPGHDPTRFISPSALMISMSANLIVERARGIRAAAGMDFGKEGFELELAGGRLSIRAVKRPASKITFAGNGNVLAVAVYGQAPISALVAKGMIAVQGDVAAAQSFVDLFRLQRPGE